MLVRHRSRFSSQFVPDYVEEIAQDCTQKLLQNRIEFIRSLLHKNLRWPTLFFWCENSDRRRQAEQNKKFFLPLTRFVWKTNLIIDEVIHGAKFNSLLDTSLFVCLLHFHVSIRSSRRWEILFDAHKIYAREFMGSSDSALWKVFVLNNSFFCFAFARVFCL